MIRKTLTAGALVLSLSVAGFTAGNSDVADAAMRGDRAAVQTLLQQRADVNAPQTDGATALHWAVYKDDLETAEQLIRAGANVKAANRLGATPLSMAAINGNAAMIEKLLNAGADVNELGPNGETPLMLASRTGSVDSIRLLASRGADVNAKEKLRDTTALMWAAEQKHPAAVQALIAAGADINARNTIVSETRGGRGALPDSPATEATVLQSGGLTALLYAVREGDLESVKVLLNAGVSVNQATMDGWTPLLMATYNRYYKLGEYLIGQGADTKLANRAGWTPLYLATDNRNIEGGDYPTRKPDMNHLDFIKLLLNNGADPNARSAQNTEDRKVFTGQWLNENGATPFLRAAQSGDMELMKLLLAHGADPKIATEQNITALATASGIGWVEGLTYEYSPEQTIEVIKMLLDLGLDPNEVDTNGRIAMHGAAHKGRNEVIQILADAGSKLDVRDKGSRDTRDGPMVGFGWLPLDFAEGLVRVGVQSAIPHPESAALLRKLMTEQGLPVPAIDRNPNLTLCLVSELCQ
jgi:ankyrin repeat protein